MSKKAKRPLLTKAEVIEYLAMIKKQEFLTDAEYTWLLSIVLKFRSQFDDLTDEWYNTDLDSYVPEQKFRNFTTEEKRGSVTGTIFGSIETYAFRKKSAAFAKFIVDCAMHYGIDVKLLKNHHLKIG